MLTKPGGQPGRGPNLQAWRTCHENRAGGGRPALGPPPPTAFFLALLAVACVRAYLPSGDGPFVFDDIRNIVENHNIRMTRLDPASLWRAMVPATT